MSTEQQIETACEVMHDAYEQAAVGAGWETNPASRKPWADVPEPNKATMRSAVGALLDHLAMSTDDLREYVKDRLSRYPGLDCALHYDLRHWLMEHAPAPDETREALAAMVSEGEAAGMYADDHGAAGFCTGHGQAALDVDAIRESVETADGNGENCPLCVPGTDDLCAYHQGYDAGWAKGAERAHAARDADLLATEGVCHHQNARYLAMMAERNDLLAEVDRLRGSADAWWTEYNKALTEIEQLQAPCDGGLLDDDIECAGCDREGPAAFWDDDDQPWCATCHDAHYTALWAERDALLAEVERLRAIGPIAWTFGQQARADRAEAREAALRERVAAEIIDVRRTHSRIKGGCDSLLRRHVMGALHDAAVRVRDNAHADDEYPADWLADLGLTVTDTPTEGGAR